MADQRRHRPVHTLKLFNPYIVGYMSVDESRQYHSDLSQLKFFTGYPEEPLSLDLNHNIDQAVKRTTDDNNERINLLLKFLLHRKTTLPNFDQLIFVTYRRSLISVMCSAFGLEQVRIMASLYDGSIYLCSFETPNETKRRLARTEQEQKFCAWGYKFQQYILSDQPNQQPDIQRPVVENEEFSLYYHFTIGQHELLHGAQIDGMLANNDADPNPPSTTDVNTNLSFLRNNSFLELKTNREIEHHRQEQNFKKYKLFRSWCQCYLADLKGVLVGFRDDDGIIQRLQWYDTEDILRYCKDEWDPRVAVQFLDTFLSYVKESFKDQLEKLHGKDCDLKKIDPVNIQFDIDSNKIFTATFIDKMTEETTILPDWYVNNKEM